MGDKRIDPELVGGSQCFCRPLLYFLFPSHLASFTPPSLPPSLVCVTRLFSLLSSLLCRSLSSSYLSSLGSTANRLAVLAPVHTSVKTSMPIFPTFCIKIKTYLSSWLWLLSSSWVLFATAAWLKMLACTCIIPEMLSYMAN